MFAPCADKGCRSRGGRGRDRPRGFTLIEILIVISIIALLSSLVALHLQRARIRAQVAVARITVGELEAALERYLEDEGSLPGVELRPDPDRNDFPVLWAALFGAARPAGPGGRSSPYGKVTHETIAVIDAGTGAPREARRVEREDDRVEKYLLDPWGQPYVYRIERGPAGGGGQRRPTPAIYSQGPNGTDETAGGGDGGDDVFF